jgi:hypothetical protein
MAASLLITISRRRAPSTWCCISGKAFRQDPTLTRHPIFTRVAASPTSFHLARQVSVSYDKSPPRMTSLCSTRLSSTSAWAQRHGSGEATDACREGNLHVTREQQLAAMQATCPGRSLNASLTSRATTTSPSTSTLPHTKLSPRHSHGPRLRLTRGKSSKYLGRLRRDQTTRGEGQVFWSE